MTDMILTEQMIDVILKQWPQTVDVFNYYSSSCIGCAIAPFCTIEDAVRYYGLPKDKFIHALQQAIEQKSTTKSED